jgi:site-specific DNA-methyltransferase (adenine-specific)
VLADLPYGTTACKWDSIIPLDTLWREYKRILKPRGAVVLTAAQPFTSALVMSNPKWFRCEWIWNKRFAANMAQCNKRPMKVHESVLVFAPNAERYNPQMIQRTEPITMGGRNIIGEAAAIPDKVLSKRLYWTKYPESIISISNRSERRGLHPTQKPVALMAYLIRTYSNPGDLVLDNTAGSGTTGVAAIETGRRAILIEQDADYYRIMCERIAAAQPPLLPEAACA